MSNYFVKGLPSIGKSLSIEQYIEDNYNSGIYIGTLWHSDETAETIRIHKERRKNTFWKLFEVSCDLHFDLRVLKTLSGEAVSGVAILLDNPTAMVCNYCTTINDFDQTGRIIVDELISNLFYCENDLYLIDNVFDENHAFISEISNFQNQYEKIFYEKI